MSHTNKGCALSPASNSRQHETHSVTVAGLIVSIEGPRSKCGVAKRDRDRPLIEHAGAA
jgi:hypothetical protein